MKLYMLRGLPACGKSTRRREMQADPAFVPLVAVNKDEIRKELGIVPGDFKREKEVLRIESERIHAALDSGFNVVVDNTHNGSRHAAHYQQLADQYGYDFQLLDMSDVPLEECIRRDALRTGGEHVGEHVIRRMWEQFYK